MVSSNEIRLRLCDPNKKRIPFIKEQLRKKVTRPWFSLSQQELSRYELWPIIGNLVGLFVSSRTICLYSSNYLRIRKPFESYDKELLEEGYPESSLRLQRLLAVRNEMGERDTALIDDKVLLNRTMSCLKHLENCERDKCK